MKIQTLFLSLALLLTGCSTPHQVFKNHDHLPVQQESQLIGQSGVRVKSTLGEPLSIRTEKPNQVWTYRQSSCTTLLYLDQNQKVCYAESRGECPKKIALNTLSK